MCFDPPPLVFFVVYQTERSSVADVKGGFANSASSPMSQCPPPPPLSPHTVTFRITNAFSSTQSDRIPGFFSVRRDEDDDDVGN